MSDLAQENRNIPIKAYVICGLAALFYVYDYFIQVAPSVMTQQLMRAFSIDAAGLGILGASFFYSYTLMQIPAGLLIDRWGARILLTGSVFLSALGVTIFGFTTHLAWAAFARFIIGLGSSCAFISAIFLVARWFPHRYFALMAGIIQLGGCLGSIFGEAPLAISINYFGWREMMVTIGIATFILVIIYGLLIRDGNSAEISDFHLVLSNEWQRLRYLMKQSQMWWIALAGLVCWVPVGIIGALWGVPYLMKVYGWSNVTAGKMTSLFWVGLGIGSPLIGWYSNRIRQRRQPLIFCFFAALISTMIVLGAAHFSPIVTAGALFLLGMSASVQSLTFGIIKDIIPPNAFGTASGITNMAAILGGGISQTIVGFVLHFAWNGERLEGLPVYTVNNYQIAFILLVIAAAVGVWVSFFKIRETHCEFNYGGEKSCDVH